jgi:hypothetical protein
MSVKPSNLALCFRPWPLKPGKQVTSLAWKEGARQAKATLIVAQKLPWQFDKWTTQFMKIVS